MQATHKNTTIFKNIHDTQTAYYISTLKALSRIKDGASKDLVKKIRNRNVTKEERQELDLIGKD